MTRAKISEYDASAGNNTDVNGTNVAEGCAPSGINNAIREVMAALKRFETGADGDSLTVGGSLVVSGSTTANTLSASVLTLSTDLAVTEGGTGASTASAARENLSAVGYTTTTGSVIITSGTEAQRDGSPDAGYFRFNTDSSSFEGYNGTSWGSVGGGATGGGSDAVFIENDQSVTTNYTIPATKNAMSTGPLSIDSGVTVTVSSGSRWVVI
jgi:hypothetical protein